jgi:hypothetical protein
MPSTQKSVLAEAALSLPSPARRRIAFSAASGLLLAACGGGDRVAVLPGGGGSGTVPPAPPQALGLLGSITNLNPLTVNGLAIVNFQGAVAGPEVRTIIEDDEGGGLKLGMVVTINGSVTAGVASPSVTATELSARAELRSGIESISANSLVVAGQRVRVHAGTVFAGISALAQLSPGDTVQVHGLPQVIELMGSAGPVVQSQLWATRIEKLTRTDLPAIITGGVLPNGCDGCAPSANLFRINSLPVQFAPLTATPSISLPIELGTIIRARASLTILPPITVAESVRPYLVEPLANGSVSRVQGFITRRLNGSLRLASLPLRLAASLAQLPAAEQQLWLTQPVEAQGTTSADCFEASSIRVL